MEHLVVLLGVAQRIEDAYPDHVEIRGLVKKLKEAIQGILHSLAKDA